MKEHILFVCRGNVGRSQMAEALLNKHSEKYIASSAGTKLSGPEQTIESLLPKTEHVLAVMKEEGVDISQHKRKQITPEMIQKFKKIILTIDQHDPVPDFLKIAGNTEIWETEDPKGKDLDRTREIKDSLKKRIIQMEKDEHQ